MQKHPKIVVIGGGTGSFTLLSALKSYTKNLTALVNMADDGGSTGVLRDEFGVLPPGDIRQCLVALSESPQALRDLFNYRFPDGSSLAGHSFGNLFISAVEMMSDSFPSAVSLASEVLQITGKVIPMTLTKSKLHMATADGEIVGEFAIANTPLLEGERPKLWLMPAGKLNPAAQTAIAEADIIVIAPGNLYGSLVPALLVDGVADALQSASAPVLYVCNLVNKANQTQNFHVHDYVHELERFIGEGTVDYVLYNTDKPTKDLLEAYALDNEFPVQIDAEIMEDASYQAIGRPFLSHLRHARNPHDKFIKRSLIRHDADKVSEAILQLLRERSHE